MADKGPILGRARAVLARLLSLPSGSNSTPLLGNLLGAAEQAESNTLSTSVRITVYGPDRAHTAQKFITAVLDDPLSSDDALHSHVKERWNLPRPFNLWNFHHSHTATHPEGSTPLPSPFLSRFAHSIILQELAIPPSDNTNTLPSFLTSDIPILLITPYLTSTDTLSALSDILPSNPNGLIILNTGLHTSSETARLLQKLLGDKLHYNPSRILFVDIERALRGLDTLRANPHSPVAIKQYQDDILGSNLQHVIAVLEETIKLGPSTLRASARAALTARVISSCSSLLDAQYDQIGNIQTRVQRLRNSLADEKDKLSKEVLGAAAEETEVGKLEMGEEEGHIVKGVEKAAKAVKPTMDSLTWWKLPLVVDDVSARVDRAVEGACVKEFQNQLVYQTGRLSYLQLKMVDRANKLHQSLLPSIASSVLQNTLSQISSKPSFPLSPTTLLTPLYIRLRQLSYATRALHVTAQRLLLLLFSSSALSTAAAYSMWVAGYMDIDTAAGAGMLAAGLGLRYAVGQWEHAKKDWWGDWQRVGEGLERDVKRTVEEVLDKQICIVPETACKGIEDLIAKRKAEIEEADSELGVIVERVEKQK